MPLGLLPAGWPKPYQRELIGHAACKHEGIVRVSETTLEP